MIFIGLSIKRQITQFFLEDHSLILKSSLVNEALLTTHLLLFTSTFSRISFLRNQDAKIKGGIEMLGKEG